MDNGNVADKLTVYTPVWEDDGEHFKAWLEIGSAWRDEHGKLTHRIDRLPLNPEENFTGAYEYTTAGAPPPAPLTITQDEFLGAYL